MNRLVLSTFQAKPLLAKRTALPSVARSSSDLNRTKVDVSLSEDGALFGEVMAPWSALEIIAKEDRKVFEIAGDELRALQVFSEETGWVRSLCPTESAPAVLVSGIPMHRIKNTDPMRDTAAKIAALGTQRGRVLDTATGLGYTAISAAKTAREVVTIELDPAAIQIARLNPWSEELFTRLNISQIVGDSAEVIYEMAAGSFGAIVHDPPTMALGGELYSEEFYRGLHRLLSRGGKLFHYIADPESALGKRTWPGVLRRLSQAGFKKLERHPEAFGVTAQA